MTSFGSVVASDDIEILSGDAIEILTVNGTSYFHAKGIGVVTLTDGEKVQKITVEKAKISLVLVMGQSNSVSWSGAEAGGMFAGALSDISSPLGTAYYWGKNSSTPDLYTEASRGIHSTLIAELYAQSVAAGNPVKNVLIWQNGLTSVSGSSISNWATPSAATQTTEEIAAMVKKCRAYFLARAEYYEIVSGGMYWLQGEIDGSTNTEDHTAMDPETYEDSFMKMWGVLNKGTGLSYVAFLRVRRDVADNQFPNADTPDHNDLTYTTALSAQLKMIAKQNNFYLATTLTENWVGTEDTEHTINIHQYYTLMEQYSGGDRFEDEYGNVAIYSDGTLTTTMKELFGSINYCHYGKFGYTLLGADAAYNMYHALNGGYFSFVQGDTSGSPETQVFAVIGEQQTIDISEMTEDLVFRASVESTMGKLKIVVKSGEDTITNDVTIDEGAHYGALSTEALKTYDNVTITVTYTPKSGTAGSVVYTIVK